MTNRYELTTMLCLNNQTLIFLVLLLLMCLFGTGLGSWYRCWCGIALSASQADQLKILYDSLHNYDKRWNKAHLKAICHSFKVAFVIKEQLESIKTYTCEILYTIGPPIPPLGPASIRTAKMFFILPYQNHPGAGRKIISNTTIVWTGGL